MKFFRGASVVALLMILFMGAGGLLVGCSGGDNTPEVPESPDPPPAAEPEENEAPQLDIND